MSESPGAPRGGRPSTSRERASKLFQSAPTSQGEQSARKLLAEVIKRARALRQPRERRVGRLEPFSERKEAIKVALISMPVTIRSRRKGAVFPANRIDEPKPFVLHEVEFDHYVLCLRPQAEALNVLQAWCDALKDACRTAVANGARVLVINELGYPNFWPGRARNMAAQRTDQQQQLREMRANLDRDLQEIASKAAGERGAIIVAGTYHDAGSFHNQGTIFFKDEMDTREHRKLTTAYRTGEYVRTELDRYYPVYNAGNFRFSVLVCSDAFDLNIFFRQMTATNNDTIKPQMVFIPSWHEQVAKKRRRGQQVVAEGESAAGGRNYMAEAARQLSTALEAVVVFVNQAFCEHRHRVYYRGEEMALRSEGCISYFDYLPKLLASSRLPSMQEELQKLLTPKATVIVPSKASAA